ncbi:MAG: hypothetical protein JNL05_10550 [Flavobacteriales bacterium]|nr:hypothetical protein [Flavobacteriales bacterium]
MSFRGPSILKVNGGLGQQAPSDRNVAGLIIASGYEAGDFTFGVHTFNSLEEAEELGLSASTDANATVGALTWYHISEFFRLNPDGKLYVFNGDGLDMYAAFDPASAADQLMTASSNNIRFIGLVAGFPLTGTLALANGYFDGVKPAADAAQAWVDDRRANDVYIDVVVLEGVQCQTATVEDLKTWELPQVAVVAMCDQGYLNGYAANFRKSAAVGTALGSIGVRMLSESIGSVDIATKPGDRRGEQNYSLTSTRQNRWVSGLSISSNVLFDALTQAKKTELTNKGVIYAGAYAGYEGVYLNGDPTAALVTDDFNSINANRVWNECARRIRRALIPRMNSRVLIDPATGRIKASTIAEWDAAAKRELEALLGEGEIADFRFTMDPNQDVVAQGKVITRLRIVKQGIAKAIEAEIGFTNPAQA